MEVVSIASAVKQPFVLEVEGVRYTVEFPLSAVIRAESKIGHSLKFPADWFGLDSKDIPALLEAGLMKHHPEITSAQVALFCEDLDPEACNAIREALGALAFPRATAKYKENLERIRTGQVSPKAESPEDR